ncbi:biopolymer transport protein ExbD/TolR family protein [gut metagenome]|uniref:Biopolymer transport protein ExbD/TolR family protein n=1 Tax=gut metagenome TaxID=749906 RepID=J9DBN9_9ZZZZ
MGRFKVKKQDMHIDMTPMSDVMVLLLTFFMLTATFVKDEPVKVNTPGSVSEIKIPESNLLTIFVEKNGKVFMAMDSPANMMKLGKQMTESGSLSLNDQQLKVFSEVPMFGTPLNVTTGWLAASDKNGILVNDPKAGIPCDSVNDELKVWVKAARTALGEGQKDMRIAIKADATTSYKVIKNVMNSLRSIHEDRYNLITSLKAVEN